MTCYAYDKKLAICLIYGCPCDCDSKKECFHRSEEEARQTGLVFKYNMDYENNSLAYKKIATEKEGK